MARRWRRAANLTGSSVSLMASMSMAAFAIGKGDTSTPCRVRAHHGIGQRDQSRRWAGRHPTPKVVAQPAHEQHVAMRVGHVALDQSGDTRDRTRGGNKPVRVNQNGAQLGVARRRKEGDRKPTRVRRSAIYRRKANDSSSRETANGVLGRAGETSE